MATSMGSRYVVLGCLPQAFMGGEFMLCADFPSFLPLPGSALLAIWIMAITLLIFGPFLFLPTSSPIASSRQINKPVVGISDMVSCASAQCCFRTPTV